MIFFSFNYYCTVYKYILKNNDAWQICRFSLEVEIKSFRSCDHPIIVQDGCQCAVDARLLENIRSPRSSGKNDNPS